MFEAIQASFSRDPSRTRGSHHTVDIPELPELRALFALFGGGSFREGLYRVIDPDDLPLWRAGALYISGIQGPHVCFGYNWLGRAFALDRERPENGQPGVVMFEPGTGEALEIPVHLVDFHNAEMIEYDDACLASSAYQSWRANGGSAPGQDRCIGYKIPLFLGGVDRIENMEDSSIDVYWSVMGQLIERARNLSPGTPIDVITIAD